MSLRKSATQDAPHATFEAGDWTWKVLKVNQPAKGPHGDYATWFVAAQSPHTFGGWDLGDTYAAEVLKFARLVDATDEFRAYMGDDNE